MRDRPSGAALVVLADAFGATDALGMRCRAIAAREHSAGEEAFDMIRAALIARYGAADDNALLTRLGADIRAGALDEGQAGRAALAALLRAITQQKLRESNPDYLAAVAPLSGSS